jgi:hypothetical protein
MDKTRWPTIKILTKFCPQKDHLKTEWSKFRRATVVGICLLDLSKDKDKKNKSKFQLVLNRFQTNLG